MPGMVHRTKHLARRCDLTQAEVARRSGVALDWFKKFMAGRYRDPGVLRVEKVHDFLVAWHASEKKVAEQTATETAERSQAASSII